MTECKRCTKNDCCKYKDKFNEMINEFYPIDLNCRLYEDKYRNIKIDINQIQSGIPEGAYYTY